MGSADGSAPLALAVCSARASACGGDGGRSLAGAAGLDMRGVQGEGAGRVDRVGAGWERGRPARLPM